MLHWRPQNQLAGVDNVYLVGGGTHPGSGLPTIFLSAQISTRMLCDRAGLRHSGAAETVRTIAKSRAMREPSVAGV
jgi:phytoene desaturase